MRKFSPYYQARAGMPPVLIVQGSKDALLTGSASDNPLIHKKQIT